MKFLVPFLFFSINLLGAWGEENSNKYGQKKYSFEDTIVHDRALSCNQIAKAGFNKPEQYRVHIGNSKVVTLKLETFTAKDHIIVNYGGNKIFDSGCIGTHGWKAYKLDTNGYSEFVTITVLPNCLGYQNSTRWQFLLECK